MDKVSLTVYALGAMAFALAFLNAGHMSVPRRFATHIAQWVPNKINLAQLLRFS